MIKTRLLPEFIPVSAILCLMVSLGLGLWVQDASDPLMMAPFVIMSAWLAMTGRLLQLKLNDPALLGLIALWLCWALSGVFSAFPFNSKVTWLIMSTLPISFMVWRSADFNDIWLKRIQGLLLLSGIGLSVYALLQVTVLTATPWSGRAGYPFADPNMLGIYFGLLILPVSTLLVTTSFKPVLRIALLVSLALLLAGLCATQSRSAFLGTIAGFGLCLYLVRNRILWTKQIKIALGASALGITAIIASSSFFSRFLSVFSENGDKDVISRLALWRSAFAMSLEHPLTGYGFGTFGLYYPLFRSSSDNSGGWWVHMDPLQWAVESGWQTPLVFYGLVLYIAVRVYKLARDKTLTPLQAGSAGALLCLFLNAHTAYPLHVIPFMLIAAGMIALLTPATPASSQKISALFASSMLVVLMLSLWSVVKTGSTLYYWQEINNAKSTGDVEKFTSNLTTCIQRGDPHYAFCKFLVIETALNSSETMPQTILQLINNARLYNPLLPQPDFYLGLYYLKSSPANPQPAITALKDSLAKDPTFWTARKVLVGVLATANMNREALAVLEKGTDYPLTGNDRKFYEMMKESLHLSLIGAP